jgi:hypothetical protein
VDDISPVDYALEAVALDEDSSSQYTDALEAYVPVNWNSGVDVVLSFPQMFGTATDQMKWGVLGRLGVRGYDLTLNYVQEADITLFAPGGLVPQAVLSVGMSYAL